jgi:hypothetical protein
MSEDMVDAFEIDSGWHEVKDSSFLVDDSVDQADLSASDTG